MAKFNEQLPEALEMLSRSLRAGHSIGAGFGLISQEMANPLAREFGRCYEEQNLGVSLETSLDSMAKRIPNLDLRFFAIQTKKWMSVWEHLSIWLQSFVEWSSMTSELMSGV